MNNDMKKPITDEIPSAENKEATNIFVNKLFCRLMDIADSIDDTASSNICKDVLSYHPADNPDSGSHIERHMPTDNKSNTKLNTQIGTMDTMLRRNKMTNSCFTSEKCGYELITTALTERTEEITNWLQSNKQDDREIILTTADINKNIFDPQDKYNNLGYGFTKDSRGHIDAFESQVMTVVLRKNECDENNPLGFNGLGFHIHTAYPGRRQSDLDKNIGEIKTLPDENVLSIVKKTPYYKNTTDMNRTLLMLQTSKEIPIPAKMSLYHDPHKDAIVICGPEYREAENNIQNFQKRYFIKESKNDGQKTVISAALYARDANNEKAEWNREKNLQFPDCAPEKMSKYIKNMQKCIDGQLSKFELQRTQKNAQIASITKNISDSQPSDGQTEVTPP